MPNNKSAIKRLRTNGERGLRNRMRISRLKTVEKKFLAKVAEKDMEGAKQALAECFSCLDKTASTGTIHKNKSDRKKSRLVAKLASLS